MQEVNEVIILAAGAGRRMGELVKDKPKCLLDYNGEPILTRLIKQLNKLGIKKIIITVGYQKEKIVAALQKIKENIDFKIVPNDRYEEDVNIYSMKLALEHISSPFVIFEADTIMEENLIQYVIGSDFEKKSVWFTRGKFKEDQYGGILKTDTFGKITDLKIVPKFEEKLKDYSKLTGIMRIGPQEIELFKKLVNTYAQDTIKQYYLIPWIENLHNLPCIEGDAQNYLFKTFNKEEEYLQLQKIDFDQTQNRLDKEIKLIEVKKLKPIEEFSEERVNLLMEKINQEGIWNRPICIEKNHNLVLDGQHRLQVAKRMGLKSVPALEFDYPEVAVWTLRKEEIVNQNLVIKRANESRIYPYKTVKHKFPGKIDECNFSLKELKGDLI